MKSFTGNFRGALYLKHLNNAIIWNLYNINKYSRKNFRGTVKNHKKCESLARWIFPRLQYVVN